MVSVGDFAGQFLQLSYTLREVQGSGHTMGGDMETAGHTILGNTISLAADI